MKPQQECVTIIKEAVQNCVNDCKPESVEEVKELLLAIKEMAINAYDTVCNGKITTVVKKDGNIH